MRLRVRVRLTPRSATRGYASIGSAAGGSAASTCAGRLLLSCAVVFASLATSDYAAAQVTMNQWVGARVEGSDAFLTIYKGSPANSQYLSFPDHSYLSLKINGKYYTNDWFAAKIGPACSLQSPDYTLGNAQTSLIGDTLHTVWQESGFDIVQDVYPVAFSKSGVIVLSVKIVNHSGSPLDAQAQFLLDNENSNMTGGGLPQGANDNPYIIHRYGSIFKNWQDCGPNPIPSFYLAFEFPLNSPQFGTVGVGYVNDSFPPRPLGLMPLNYMEFGDWTDQGNYTWGPPCLADRHTPVADQSTLLMGQPSTAGDGVTEIMRTAYGTPEWCDDHGSLLGFAMYPQHIIWDPATQLYTPNPFPIEAFLFNVSNTSASGISITQTIGDPIRITIPKPAGLPKDTQQTQNVGFITAGGFADIHWTDEVLVQPSGCAANIPVEIRFDVKASGIPPPIFKDTPWSCQINVDCPNPDTLPPAFFNTIANCDSIKYDTITVQDDRAFDLGLKDITYASPDLTPIQYSVTINPAPPYQCIKTPVTIFVQQVDTFQKGHVVFTLTDCAGNISTDTVCFTAHPPLPDLTAPVFWDSAVSDCHTLCTEWYVTDTVKSATSIDRGVDAVVAVSGTNMTLSGVIPGGQYPPNTPNASFHVCVTDSMLDGTIIIQATDTAHNVRLDTITYCTTKDTLPPAITYQDQTLVDSSWHVHVAETRAWDRGIDSVWVDEESNAITIPSPLPTRAILACRLTYDFLVHDFLVHVVDPTKCASAEIHTRDCAGNIDSIHVAYSKGGKPAIQAPKTVLCGGTDAIVLTATGSFVSFKWSTGETTNPITVRTLGNYQVTGDDGEGCTATSDILTIHFSPALPVIAPANPAPVCAPDSVQLDATDKTFVSYQWLKDGTQITGATLPTIRAAASGAYTIQVTNDSGCTGTSPAVTVTINPPPVQPVITSANNVLSTSSVGVTYQWYLDGTLIPGATGQSYTPVAGGNYTVTIDSNGCKNTSLPYSNAGSTVIAVPAVMLAQQSQHVTIPLSIMASQSALSGSKWTAKISVNKTLLVSDPSAPMQPSWTIVGDSLVVTYTGTATTTIPGTVLMGLPFIAALGNDSCTTVSIDAFTWSTPGIAVTTQSGSFCLSGLCTQGGTRLLDPTGTPTLSEARPNPGLTSIQIDYKLIEHGQTTLVIYDLLGREVQRLVDADRQPGTYTVAADVRTLPAGAYVYTLRTPTTVLSHHLQIAR